MSRCESRPTGYASPGIEGLAGSRGRENEEGRKRDDGEGGVMKRFPDHAIPKRLKAPEGRYVSA